MSEALTTDRFSDLELQAEVWLASEEVTLQRLLELQPGGTLRLTRDPDAAVDLMVNGSRVASGELVVVDGRFGFRVTATESGEALPREVSPRSAEAPAQASAEATP